MILIYSLLGERSIIMREQAKLSSTPFGIQTENLLHSNYKAKNLLLLHVRMAMVYMSGEEAMDLYTLDSFTIGLHKRNG